MPTTARSVVSNFGSCERARFRLTLGGPGRPHEAELLPSQSWNGSLASCTMRRYIAISRTIRPWKSAAVPPTISLPTASIPCRTSELRKTVPTSICRRSMIG